jgi:hypothetical protein
MEKKIRKRPGRKVTDSGPYDKRMVVLIGKTEEENIKTILNNTDFGSTEAGTVSQVVRLAINNLAANVGAADPREYHG